MAKKMTEREQFYYGKGYVQGKIDFAKEVVERLKKDYADTCNSEYNDGIDNAMRVIDEIAGDLDGRE